MHIGYQPLWRTLKERKHISMDTLTKICETLDCGILDVIELVRDEEQTHESD